MKKKIAVIVLFIICLSAIMNFVFATDEQNYEEVNNPVFEYGDESVIKNKIINGNVYVMAETVTIRDVMIYGDVYVLSKNLNVNNSSVYGSIFTIAENANLNGVAIINNIYAISENFTFDSGVQDFYGIISNLKTTAESTVTRDMMTLAIDANINSSISRTFNGYVENLEIGPNAQIGNLNYSSENEAIISNDAIIGIKNYNKIENEAEEESKPTLAEKTRDIAMNTLAIIVKSFIIIALITYAIPSFVEKQKQSNYVSYFGFSILKGLGWSIFIPLFALALMFTGFTFGLSATILAIYMIVFWASVPIVSVSIMTAITNGEVVSKTKQFGYSLAVAAVIAILKQIPQVSGLITLIVGLAGLAIFIKSFGKTKFVSKETEVVVENKIEE